MGQQGRSGLRSRRQTAQGPGAVSESESQAYFIPVGRISGVYGIRGWVRVYSYTRPRENIIRYQPWYLKGSGGDWLEKPLAAGSRHGKGVIARLAGCENRDQVQALMGCEIAIRRDQLPDAAPGEYYWRDLQGLTVVTIEGELLGTVDHLIETGANDVLVVKGDRERLIPFVLNQAIVNVDLDKREIRVDWDKDF